MPVQVCLCNLTGFHTGFLAGGGGGGGGGDQLVHVSMPHPSSMPCHDELSLQAYAYAHAAP